MTPGSVRPPAVAGSFYPASPAVLGTMVDSLLQAARPLRAGQPEPLPAALPKALIVPHAGYIYSGPVAASAFSLVWGRAEHIERVLLIGPAHRVFVDGLAWPDAARMQTPLGEIEVDVEAIARVGVSPSAAAHAREHSLEVELPFLQRVAPRARVVPLVVGRAAPEVVGQVIDALWGGPETLIVISSDLSHFLTYDDGRELDEQTAARILALDPDLDGDEACGAAGINGLLWVARRRGLRPRLLDLRSSGDTAGPREQVVGYGAFALHAVTS